MRKMSPQERQAYERAMERRKRQSRQADADRRRPGQRPAGKRTGRTEAPARRRRSYEEDYRETPFYGYDDRRYGGQGYGGYGDYDDGYDEYNEYDEYELPPRRKRMPEDLDFRYGKESRKKPRRRAGQGNTGRDGQKEPVRRRKNGRLVLLIQLLATGAFLLSAVYLGMIPWLYLGIGALLLLLLAFGIYRMQNGFRRKRFTGAFLGLLLSVSLGAGAYYMAEIRMALAQITGGDGAPELKEKAESIHVGEEPFSVYISGIDVYGDIAQQSRSDVNIIATVNPKTKEVLLVTTPRDYYVEIPGVSNGKKDKLTHAGNYGIGTSVATLENLYETEIPFYVRVNFTSLIQMVDTLGGIDVESDLAFTTGPESGLVMEVKKGINHFNGKQALAFSRERHALAEGDNQRGKNQQRVIEAMLKKAVSPSILIKGPKLIDEVSGNTETNMSVRQIQELVRVQLAGMKGWKVTSVAAEGTGKKAYCYSYSAGPLYVTVPDENSVSDIQKKINAAEAGK